jgi:hypothetical protein
VDIILIYNILVFVIRWILKNRSILLIITAILEIFKKMILECLEFDLSQFDEIFRKSPAKFTELCKIDC